MKAPPKKAGVETGLSQASRFKADEKQVATNDAKSNNPRMPKPQRASKM